MILERVPVQRMFSCRSCAGACCPICDNTGKARSFEDLGRYCRDCSEVEHYQYMVRKPVWYQAMPDYAEQVKARNALPNRPAIMLCLPCLEKRLGRPLASSDFDLNLPGNQLLRWGMLLATRVGDSQ